MARSTIRNTVIPIFKYNIKALVLDFKDGFLMLVANLFLKDPCKKCLVRACCSDQCEIKIQTINMMLPHKTILHAKLFSIAILSCFTFSILSLTLSLFSFI